MKTIGKNLFGLASGMALMLGVQGGEAKAMSVDFDPIIDPDSFTLAEFSAEQLFTTNGGHAAWFRAC